MSHTITLRTTPAGTVFSLGDRTLGTALSMEGAADRFLPLGDGVFRWVRRTQAPVQQMMLRFEAAWTPEFTMLPACQYDGNTCEAIMDYEKIRRITNGESEEGAEHNYYKGDRDEKTGQPWRLAYWNMSIPGATCSEGMGLSAGLFLPPEEDAASASLYAQDGITRHELHWPEQMGPRIPHKAEAENALHEPAGIPGKVRSGTGLVWQEGYLLPMEPRQEFQAILVLGTADRPRTGYRQTIAAAWDLYRKEPVPRYSQQELWDLGISFAKRLYDEDDQGFKACCFGLMYVDGTWIPRPLYRYEMGWCGQSLMNAVSLLRHALTTGDREAEQMGFATLDSWLSRENPTGLLPTHLEEQEYTHYGRRIADACNLGGGAIQLFQAGQLAPMLGRDGSGYTRAAIAICDFALRVMEPSGRIGKSWTEDDLQPVLRDGTTGAFLTMALCQGARCTGRMDYLEAARRSYDYYYQEFCSQGFTMGGAQDIFTIDKESAMPLLKAGLSLYRLTGEKDYLDKAEDAAWYLATWQWCYTRKLHPDSTLSKLGYDSFGGTSVSIHGPGQDPYALYYVHDLYDLAELTGHRQWAQRAHAAWCNGMDGVSDGTMVADGRLIPPGGQHEARGLGGGFQGLYQWLVAWPTAFRLELLRRTQSPLGDRPGRTL